jgi:hypothetical protein
MNIVDDNVTISDDLANTIVSFLDQKLSDNKRRAYPMPDIFKDNEAVIKKELPEVDKYKFQKALSLAIKDNRLAGYEIKLGKGGGVGKASYVKPGSLSVAQNVTSIVQSIVEDFATMEFNGKSYQMDLSTEKLEKLLVKVFGIKEDPDGNIKFNDRTYSCEKDSDVKFIEDLTFYFAKNEDVELQQSA